MRSLGLFVIFSRPSPYKLCSVAFSFLFYAARGFVQVKLDQVYIDSRILPVKPLHYWMIVRGFVLVGMKLALGQAFRLDS